MNHCAYSFVLVESWKIMSKNVLNEAIFEEKDGTIVLGWFFCLQSFLDFCKQVLNETFYPSKGVVLSSNLETNSFSLVIIFRSSII